MFDMFIKLEMHPEKSRIYPLYSGVNFLGFRIFYYHKLLKKSNAMHGNTYKLREKIIRMIPFQN